MKLKLFGPITTLLFLSINTIVFSQTDHQEKQALRSAKKAEKSFVKGKFEKCIILYSDAIDLAPHIVHLYHDRGMAYKANDQPYKAIADFTKIIQKLPNDEESLWQRGQLYLNLNLHTRALEDFDSYLITHPDKAKAYFYKTQALEGLRKNEAAEISIKKAIKLEPRNSLFQLYYAKLLIDKRDFKGAEKILNDPLKTDSTLAYHHLVSGYLLLEKNELSKAKDAINKSLQISTADTYKAFSNFLLASISLMEQNNSTAETYFNRAIELDPEALYYFARGSYYAEINDTAAALRDFNQTIQLDPNYTGAYNNRTFYIWFPQQKFENALADMNKIIALDSMNAFAYNNRAYAYRGLDRYELAYLDAFHSMELVPRNPYTYKNIALFYDDFNDQEGAKENILKALQLNFPVDSDPEFKALLKKYGLENAY